MREPFSAERFSHNGLPFFLPLSLLLLPGSSPGFSSETRGNASFSGRFRAFRPGSGRSPPFPFCRAVPPPLSRSPSSSVSALPAGLMGFLGAFCGFPPSSPGESENFVFGHSGKRFRGRTINCLSEAEKLPRIEFMAFWGYPGVFPYVPASEIPAISFCARVCLKTGGFRFPGSGRFRFRRLSEILEISPFPPFSCARFGGFRKFLFVFPAFPPYNRWEGRNAPARACTLYVYVR